MKIAIVRTDSSFQDVSSYNSQEIGLAKALRNLGHDVYVLVAKGSIDEGAIGNLKAESGIVVVQLPFFTFPLLREPIYYRFNRYIESEKFDYVQINEEANISSALACLGCASKNIRFGLYQGMYKILSGRKWKLYEVLHNVFLRPIIRKKASLVCCKTTRAREFLERRGYKDVRLLPVGLDVDKFSNRKSFDWHRELGLDSDANIILYVGSIEQRRNPLFIAELAKSADKNWHFVMVGEGPLIDEVAQYKKEMNLGNLYLLGRVPQADLGSLYKLASVLLLPSSYEIYGMVIAEALYFGVPVISTRTAGAVDIIEEEDFGLLSDDLDRRSWLRGINSYISSGNEDDKSRKRRTYVESKLCWDTLAADYVSMIGSN